MAHNISQHSRDLMLMLVVMRAPEVGHFLNLHQFSTTLHHPAPPCTSLQLIVKYPLKYPLISDT